MTLNLIESRAEALPSEQPRPPQVITGEQFRREILGWSKRPFYALVKSGRIAHLRAINLCTARRTFYVKAQAELWATQTPGLTLRARRQHRAAGGR